MSTHATPETRAEPSVEPATGSDRESDSGDDSARDPFETHDAAATFGASERRLPNTVDRENKYVG